MGMRPESAGWVCLLFWRVTEENCWLLRQRGRGTRLGRRRHVIAAESQWLLAEGTFRKCSHGLPRQGCHDSGLGSPRDQNRGQRWHRGPGTCQQQPAADGRWLGSGPDSCCPQSLANLTLGAENQEGAVATAT